MEESKKTASSSEGAPSTPPMTSMKHKLAASELALEASPVKRARTKEAKDAKDEPMPSFDQIWENFLAGEYDARTQTFGRKGIYTKAGILAARDVLMITPTSDEEKKRIAQANAYMGPFNSEAEPLFTTLPATMLVDSLALHPSTASASARSKAMTSTEVEIVEATKRQAKLVVSIPRDRDSTTPVLVKNVYGTLPELKSIVVQTRCNAHLTRPWSEELKAFRANEPALFSDAVLQGLSGSTSPEDLVAATYFKFWNDAKRAVISTRFKVAWPSADHSGVLSSVPAMQFVKTDTGLYIMSGAGVTPAFEAVFDFGKESALSIRSFYGTAADLLLVLNALPHLKFF